MTGSSLLTVDELLAAALTAESVNELLVVVDEARRGGVQHNPITCNRHGITLSLQSLIVGHLRVHDRWRWRLDERVFIKPPACHAPADFTIIDGDEAEAWRDRERMRAGILAMRNTGRPPRRRRRPVGVA